MRLSKYSRYVRVGIPGADDRHSFTSVPDGNIVVVTAERFVNILSQPSQEQICIPMYSEDRGIHEIGQEKIVVVWRKGRI